MIDARDIANALEGERYDDYYACRCPAPNHGKGEGDRKRSLLVRDGDRLGRVLVNCRAGCEQGDVIAALRAIGLWGRGDVGSENVGLPKTHTASPRRDNTPLARRIWDNSAPAAGTPVEIYLRSRGITIPPPPTIRSHAALLHKPTGTRWPAMVAMVKRGDLFVGVHRTFLARDGSGKADLGEHYDQKMTLGPVRGGAVRLGPAAESLCVTEGIETGLSVMQATGRAVWVALSAVGMKTLELPQLVREVLIYADADPTGERMARKAAERWLLEGREVRVAIPPPGKDFNDLLMESD